MNKATRKHGKHLRVPVLPEEEELINANARKVGLSTAAFLRNVGMGMEVRGVLDQQAVIEMAKVNGDLGRLGGLLKMWLTNDERLAGYDQEQLKQTILGVLAKIDENQQLLLATVKKL